MTSATQCTIKTAALLSIVMLLVVFGRQTAAAQSSPGQPVAGTHCAPACDLYAGTGTLTLPGTAGTVPIWGYATLPHAPVQSPGPTLIVDQGDTVTINLINNLDEPSALMVHGLSTVPDLTGALPNGGTMPYSFVADQPGTYLYEAGLTANGKHQIAMGMVGALIVRPTDNGTALTGQAYGDTASAYDDEALVFLSEIDPALNSSPNPAAFDLRDFKPRYRLINGKAYPETIDIASDPGRTTLLRYVNSGLEYHVMGTLGLEQTIIGTNGIRARHDHAVVAQAVAAGETIDVLVTMPPSTPFGARYPLYESSFLLHNNGANGFGGLLAFITTEPGGTGSGDILGPTTTGPTAAPSPTDGTVDVTLIASVSDAATGSATIQAAEYFVDTTGTDGTGQPMTPLDSAFDSSDEGVEATIAAAVLSGLGTGDHTIYIHGQDSEGNWGAFNLATLSLDLIGPKTTGLALAPNPTQGGVDLSLSGTANDVNRGNSGIAAAEYFIDTAGADGAGNPVIPNSDGPVAALQATVPGAMTSGLSEGSHRLMVHSQDSFGHWGTYAEIPLLIDRTGPEVSDVTVAPSPNNGSQGINPSQPSIRVDAVLIESSVAAASLPAERFRIYLPYLSGGTADDSSMIGTIVTGAAIPMVPSGVPYVKTAEGFIDVAGADGSGFPLTPADGLFNSAEEAAYAFIPLTTIGTLSEGQHQIWVHGQDGAGNWGTPVAAGLLIDKSKPVVSGPNAAPNPTNGQTGNNTSFTLSATAQDAWTNIVAAEWYDGADPGQGNGTAIAFAPAGSVNLSAVIDFVSLDWAAGNHTIAVRARDAVGLWSDPVAMTVTVVLPDTIFADDFESGTLAAWNGGITGTNISATAAAAMDGGFGLQAVLNGIGSAGYVTDLTPRADGEYHAAFRFDPNGAVTGNNQAYTIFAGLDATGAPVVQVQYRRQNAGGGRYQMRLTVQRAGGTSIGNWVTISNAPHTLQLAWRSGPSVPVSLTIDGATQTLSGLNTGAYLLESVRLGPSAGLSNQAGGALYFDSFTSTRRTAIVP